MASIEPSLSLNGSGAQVALDEDQARDDVSPDPIGTDAEAGAGAIEAQAETEGIEAEAIENDVEPIEVDSDAVEAAAEASEPDFLSELAVAMRGVAGQERDRLSARAAEDAAAHIDDARARGTTEAESLRQLADDDIAAIDAWAETEIERVRAEAAERTETRRAELATALERHEAVIDDEVGAIEAATLEYDESLALFLQDLDRETDPSELARRARLLPARPDLERVREQARDAALAPTASDTEAAPSVADTDGSGSDDVPTPIGVMEPADERIDSDPAEDVRQPWVLTEASHEESGPIASTTTTVRLLRTVAPWTAPSRHDVTERDEVD